MIIGLAGPFNPQAVSHRLFPGDAERVPLGENGIPLELLAQALLDRGHRVVVYTLDQNCQGFSHFQGPNLSIRIGPYRPCHRMRDGFAAERRALVAMMRDESPDILHAHWSYEYALAALRANCAPVLTTIHDWAPSVLRFQPSPYRLGRLVMNVASMIGSRYVSAPSPHIASKVERWFRRSCPVIPHGLPQANFALAPRRFPAGAPVLVAANQGFSRFKNVSALLRSFPAIRTVFSEARLELLGYGHEPGGPAEQWARSHGLTEGVEFIGQVPAAEVIRHFAAAHVMVHPAIEEAFGHVLIEAMSQGTPVVAMAQAAGPAWVLGHGRSGVLTTPDSLAPSCLELLTNPTRWEEVARAGWEAACRDYGMDRVAETYLGLYRAVLAGSPQGVARQQQQKPGNNV